MSQENPDKDLQESLYPLSVPGMREGLETPIEECSEDPGWPDDRTAEAEEKESLSAMACNPAFADLAAPEEDIYSPEDGEPFPLARALSG